MKFTCGHEAEEPNMGRGAARSKKLAQYFDRKCYQCTVTAIKASVAGYTHINGAALSPDEQGHYVGRRIAKLRY